MLIYSNIILSELKSFITEFLAFIDILFRTFLFRFIYCKIFIDKFFALLGSQISPLKLSIIKSLQPGTFVTIAGLPIDKLSKRDFGNPSL